MAVRHLGLVVHGGRPDAVQAATTVRAWADEHAVPVTDLDVWEDRPGPAAGEPDTDYDLVVTVGGDGTFLRGARAAAPSGAAVLGVNVGRVGFLTEVESADTRAALDAYADGSALVEQRLTLTLRASRELEVPAGLESLLRYGRGPLPPAPEPRDVDPDQVGWGVALDVTAVNDVVFEKLARDRQASLGLYLDGNLFASYSADALVVASPTGSTAYSFAAGGPVLSPRLSGLVFTPVAAHMVFDRSLVLAADEVVAVRVLDRSGQVAVSIDGQLRGVLDPGDWVATYASDRPVRLVRLRPTDFYTRLRSRFGLTDAPAAVADGTPPARYQPGDHLPVPDDIARLFRRR